MIRFYNTFTKSKEQFVSYEKDIAKIYSCGPTVYSVQHIGNMRAGVFVDILKRVLRYFNYKVIDVVNITDVGHLVSDEDDGEDKMLKAAKKEKKDPYEIARYYEDIYVKDLKALNIILPKYMPRATDHIKEQLKVIEELEKGGYTYKTSDGIYFDVSKFKDYGKLSKQKYDESSVSRVEKNPEKRNSQDFALWKFLTGDNKNHIMKWDSKWGIGFPGWHIECSAMSHKYLGNRFDIHTGGIEHIPVHHENEIAQNVCSHSVENIKYWLHNAHLVVDGEKMSKSLGNVYNLSNLIEMGFNPLAFREMCLRSHYRKQMNFTIDSLKAGESNLKKINDFYSFFKNRVADEGTEDINNDIVKVYDYYMDLFEKGIKDDLNTSEALAAMYEFMNEVNKRKSFIKKDISLILDFMERCDKVFGLLEFENDVPENVVALAKERKRAREDKDWNKADVLRDEIKVLGYEVKDVKDSVEGFLLTKL